MLTRIHLQNFKSWQDLDMPLANINLVFGANNSGKSSILQALLLLKQTVFHFDRSVAMHLGGLPNDWVDLGSYADVVHGHDEAAQVGIALTKQYSAGQRVAEPSTLSEYSATWRFLDSQVTLEQLGYMTWVDGAPDGKYFTANRIASGGYEYQSSYIDETRESLSVATQVHVQNCYLVALDPVNKGMLAPLEIQESTEFRHLMSTIQYIGALRLPPQRLYQVSGTTPQTIGPHGENAIEILLAAHRRGDETFIEQTTSWLAQMGIADRLLFKQLDPEGRFYEVMLKVGDKEAPITHVGYSISQVLPILVMLLTAPQGSIVLFEEPELHLHPAAQTHLADLMLYAAEQRHLQLIVESHSEHLLRRLQRRIAEEAAAFATPETIKLYFCELGKPIVPVEVNRFGQIINWPENFFGDMLGDMEAQMKASLVRAQKEHVHG